MSDSEKTYSTGQMAELLGVSKSTVRKMADRGLLRCWRTREGGHLRFSREPAAGQTAPHIAHLTRFRIHLVHGGQGHAARLPEHLKREFPHARLSHSSNIYSALLDMGRAQPQIVIADLDAASERDFAIVHSIRNHETLDKSFVLLLGSSDNGLAPHPHISNYVSYFLGSDCAGLLKAIRLFGHGYSLV
jgi:excisionase family DNA binding protein